MSPLLKDLLYKRIVVITTDGQCFVANLEGFDKNTNLILSNVIKRSTGDPISICHFLRGSDVVCCGLLEEYADETFKEAFPLKDTKNKLKNEHMIWSMIWNSKDKEINI